MSRDHFIVAHDVCSIRGDRLLFRDINLRMDPGDLVQVMGPNGSGKTTLLRILCGLTQATEGEVRWCDLPIHHFSSEFAEWSHYVGHLAGVKLELTPVENLKVAKVMEPDAQSVDYTAALHRVGLAGFEYALCRTLSAGQRRRVALSRLLISRATLWVLDEPYTSLDTAGIQLVNRALEEHLGRGGMVAIASHQTIEVDNHPLRELVLSE